MATNAIKCKTRFYRLFPSTGYLGYGFEDYEAEYGRSAFLVIDVYGLGFQPVARRGNARRYNARAGDAEPRRHTRE